MAAKEFACGTNYIASATIRDKINACIALSFLDIVVFRDFWRSIGPSPWSSTGVLGLFSSTSLQDEVVCGGLRSAGTPSQHDLLTCLGSLTLFLGVNYLLVLSHQPV
jgi:hypothetical protein